MVNKKLQRERMENYFIEAAKNIIQKEGIKSLSVRKVGEEAGYSYATLYNYFKDLNHLLTYCAYDFFDECYEFMKTSIKGNESTIEQIIVYSKAYINYFMEHPNAFQLIYIEELPPLGSSQKNFYRPSIAILLHEKIEKCAQEGYFHKNKISLIENLIKSSMQGKLLLFLKRRPSKNKEEILKGIEEEIKFIIGKDGKNEEKKR